jgi:hypothetical protein
LNPESPQNELGFDPIKCLPRCPKAVLSIFVDHFVGLLAEMAKIIVIPDRNFDEICVGLANL